MNHPQYKAPTEDAADKWLRANGGQPLKSAKAKPRKLKFGRALAVSIKVLGMGGAQSPPSKDVAEAILWKQGDRSTIVVTKADAKVVIMNFARTLTCDDVPVPRVKPKAAPLKPAARPVKVATPERKGFYWSEEWRRVRYVALRASKGACVLCGTPPAPGAPLHVDHIKPRSKFPELELDPANLQVLCADCNLGKSNTDSIDWRRPASA